MTYIYCTVRPQNWQMSLYYIDPYGTAVPGEYVFVPLGSSNIIAPGIVEKTEVFDESMVPYPVKFTKNILGPATEEAYKKAAVRDENIIGNGPKPAGYYEEIEPSDCIDDLARFLKDFSIEICERETMPDSFLQNSVLPGSETVITVKNPMKGENLEIILSEDFTVNFAGWSTCFCAYRYDYGLLKNKLKSVFDNEEAALAVYSSTGGQWCGCGIVSRKETEDFGLYGLTGKFLGRAYLDSYLKVRGGEAVLTFWNPALSRRMLFNEESGCGSRKE